MKVLIFGQATGGNALAWFDYFNRYSEKLEITLLARTICTIKHKFRVLAPYGRSDLPGIIGKVRKKIASTLLMDLYLKYISIFNKFDFIILQGNYTPETNLKVLNRIKSKSILNIYGSDFYRKYLKKEFSTKQENDFLKVLDRVDFIVCNWKSTYDDFVKEFPSLADKVKVLPWGVDTDWHAPILPKKKSTAKKFLSTRALHSYNNIDIVVEAFCKAYPHPSNNTLHIVGAYGNDKKVVEKINSIIERYGAEEQVTLELDKWYQGKELIELYDSADFNLCFGSTDQLTISIVYGLTRKVINILSPLPNYEYLIELGYTTPVIVEEISVNSLVHTFNNLDLNLSNELLEKDRERAIDMFDMNTTFNSYIEIINGKL